MKNSIKRELVDHILTMIKDGVINNTNRDDWHHIAFNEDYYLIGYYECEKWLEKHNISAFEAIEICQEYEKDNFGEISGEYDNAEKVVNMLVYIIGEDLISELDADSVEELEENINNFLND